MTAAEHPRRDDALVDGRWFHVIPGRRWTRIAERMGNGQLTARWFVDENAQPPDTGIRMAAGWSRPDRRPVHSDGLRELVGEILLEHVSPGLPAQVLAAIDALADYGEHVADPTFEDRSALRDHIASAVEVQFTDPDYEQAQQLADDRDADDDAPGGCICCPRCDVDDHRKDCPQWGA